jgi:hypothetical protein
MRPRRNKSERLPTNREKRNKSNSQSKSIAHPALPMLVAKVYSKLHNLESIRRSPPVGWGVKRIQAYFIWAKQVTDSKSFPAQLPGTREEVADGQYVGLRTRH